MNLFNWGRNNSQQEVKNAREVALLISITSCEIEKINDRLQCLASISRKSIERGDRDELKNVLTAMNGDLDLRSGRTEILKAAQREQLSPLQVVPH